MKRFVLRAFFLIASPLTISPLHAATDAIHVKGEFPKSIQTISYTLKDQSHTARCLSLLEFVQSRQFRLDPKVKNQQLGFIVLVQAKDGYTLSFNMDELLQDFGNRQVWIALDEDGKPLSEKQGPVKLVIPDEKKSARWMFGVANLLVRDGRKLSKPRK